MITTRESINYQFSLIFGYSSPEDIIVGDVIGPGKLTKEKVKELSLSVMQFLRMYNAMLRDYTGSEVFSIEFELHDIEAGSEIKIYPKSMILIPGQYKDCESLLLALKPETGILNTHKSRDELNDISSLFYEVEEFANRPDLDNHGKELVFKKFASRFSKKLFGDLIEDKWNKKLIGLNVSLPTEKELLNTYETIKSNVEILWYKSPYEIKILNPQFSRLSPPFESQAAIDHLKFSISEPSANFVIENTLKLGTNLINLANTGTIDESQDEIVSFIINQIESKINNINVPHNAKWVINEINKILGSLETYFNKFMNYSKTFTSTGEKGNSSAILNKFRNHISERAKLENENFENLCQLAINTFENSIIRGENVRAIDLDSAIYYFSELIKNTLNLIRNSLPKYFSRRRLKTLTINFITRIKEIFDKEQKPAKNLGNKFMEKFNTFIFNQIEVNPLLLSSNLKFDEAKLIKEFKYVVKENIEVFFDNIELDISDLISFAEVLMEGDSSMIKDHIDKFKRFSKELHFLLSYLLRHTTINRFLKEEPDKEISDPVTFATRFHRFLEKRTGGINLEWKFYILDWIKDYAKKFINLEEQRQWNLQEIYQDFIGYFEQRESNEQQSDKFLKVLDSYIAQVSDDDKKPYFIEFFKQYEFCNKIKGEFPKYIKKIVEKEIIALNPPFEEQIPQNFFSLGDTDRFYDYLRDFELKYFSKLIPRPLTLILKHNLTNEEKSLFKSDLFHVFNFRFWGKNNFKVDVSDNFKEAYREWVKNL
ncbi:MAG: hypothetical protein EU539_03690 [Promethearchaeota archaeon]|nr:MAG: hypothetical protein EU539_03690 [Candidatus Lokiarchaeota archaeon]